MAIPRANGSIDEFSVENASQTLADRPATGVVKSGWDAATTENSTANYPTEFKFLDGQFQIIKFLDLTGPFAVYKQHWLTQKTSGKRSYISLGANDPLCVKLGSRPVDKRAFTIANLSAEGGPQRQMLIASPRLYKSLHAAEHSPQGPLTKNYWAVSRTGEMANTAYHLNAVKERDLLEDWGIDIESMKETIAAMTPYDRSVIKEPTWEELEAIAEALS